MAGPKNHAKEHQRTQSPGTSPSAIRSLIAGLRSGDGIVRHKARAILARTGAPAVRQLIPLLKDREDDVRWEAAKTLASIADPRAASVLVASLEDPSFGVRWLAAEGLIAIGRDALTPLLAALKQRSDSIWLREGAHHVLHDLASKDLKNALSPVLTALEGVDPVTEINGPVRKALQDLRR